MQLLELMQAVKEEKLSREQLEAYSDQLSYLFADLMMETSELEKKEAMFMGSYTADVSVAYIKVQWRKSREGLRLIELKRYSLAVKELLRSLKSRVYKLIY